MFSKRWRHHINGQYEHYRLVENEEEKQNSASRPIVDYRSLSGTPRTQEDKHHLGGSGLQPCGNIQRNGKARHGHTDKDKSHLAETQELLRKKERQGIRKSKQND